MTRILMAGGFHGLDGETKALLEKEYTIIKAADGAEALMLCESEKPDMILADMELPDMTGIEMLGVLRKDQSCGTPVILTAGEDPDAEKLCISAGAADCIARPLVPEVLLGRIRNAAKNICRIKELEDENAVDSLTGLITGSNLRKRFTEACAGGSGVLMVIDLDNFTLVDEIYGENMGDRVLRYFGERLRENISGSEIAGRIQGDEFVLCSRSRKDVHSINALTISLNMMLESALQELAGEEIEPIVGASVGAVFFPEEGTEYDKLYSMADKALYTIKQHGKRGYSIYDGKNLGETVDDLDSLEKHLKERKVATGAYRISIDALGQVYHYFMRYIDRYCESAFKVLFTLEPRDSEYGSVYEIAEYFGELIARQLRRSDILVHTQQNQFFLILPDVSRENFDLLMTRILKPWYSSEYSDIIELTYESKQIMKRQ